MYMKKLRTPEWLKTSTFSCNTSVKLYTNGTRTLLKFCHLLTLCDVFSCKLFTSNRKISLTLRARRARAILFPLKKLLGLTNTKYCYDLYVFVRVSEVERELVSVTMTWVLTKPSTDSNDCPHMTHEGVTFALAVNVYPRWDRYGFRYNNYNNIIATRAKKQCLPAMT